jgi:hypothetical protein
MEMIDRLHSRFAIVCIGAATLLLIGGWLFFSHPTNGQSAVISAVQESEANAKKSAVITLFGFTPFPYDFTLKAVKKTHDIITENSTIYALHFDNGIPW